MTLPTGEGRGQEMRQALLVAAFGMIGVAAAATQTPAPVRVIVAAEASGPDGEAGRQVIDGFTLALARGGGRLGHREVVVVPFDLNRPAAEVAAQLAAMVKQEQAPFVVGRLVQPAHAPLLRTLSEAGVITLVPGWGSADLAGKRCLANVFVVGAQEDQGVDTLAKFADETGYRRLITITSRQAEGALKAFKRSYKGEILREVLLDEAATDFAKEVEGIVTDKPGAVVLLAPDGTGGRFLAQMRAVDSLMEMPVLTQAGADESRIAALGGAAQGLLSAGMWAQGLDSPENAAFITAFEAAYGYSPSMLGMQAHDAALLLGRAIGAAEDKQGAAAAAERIKQAEIKSPRGAFTFGNNNFPVQDFYVRRIEMRAAGGLQTLPVKKVFVQYGDDYAAECPLK